MSIYTVTDEKSFVGLFSNLFLLHIIDTTRKDENTRMMVGGILPDENKMKNIIPYEVTFTTTLFIYNQIN
jgi:hypothetical protein